MRKLLIVLAILAFSSMAFAGTIVNMQYNGAGSNSYGGVYTYPYNVSVNGTPESLMCIGFTEHVTGGEMWQATGMSTLQYGALIGDTLKAERLAFLYSAALANGGNPSFFNAAAWYINEGVPDLSGDPAAAQWALVVGQLTFFNPANYNHVEFYVPTTDQTGWTDGVPQTFLGSTPEPSTLLTFGSGILGLAGLVRKRLFS